MNLKILILKKKVGKIEFFFEILENLKISEKNEKIENFQVFLETKIFKFIFLQEKNIFLVRIFFCDLEFIYTFDLAHPERLRACMGSGRLHN